MKQAQQFFTTSESAGYEIKPILLYYGLNQAVRALAAMGIKQKQGWEFSSHGLTCKNIDQNPGLAGLEVVDSGQGAFQALGDLVGSPTLPERVEFGDIWCSLPQGTHVPLVGSEDRWSAVHLHVTDAQSTDDTVAWSGRLSNLPKCLGGVSKKEVELLLREHYAVVGRLGFGLSNPDSVHGTSWDGISRRPIVKIIRADNRLPQRSFERALGVHAALGYETGGREGFWYIPCLRGNEQALHTLMTWFAVLHTLSLLARYKPASWTTMLDIDKSPDAPGIEYVLDEAHSACITLIRGELAFLGSSPDLRKLR